MEEITLIFEHLPRAILPWYCVGHRDLPWRKDREPYHIWLSEIMLQQTRVEAVKGYYERFLGTLPDIASLAQADDELLHKLWEGLGYYSRVRNLKKAAQIIMEQYGGVFPDTFELVRKLPGIGDYTAGAICSIAYDLPTPAVDGNVLRVAARLMDDDTPVDTPAFKAMVRERLQKVYPVDAGDFTQALMELGATLCGPNRPPECGQCPCREFCLGHLRGNASRLPARLVKKKRRVEEKTVFILSCDGKYALRKRDRKGLLAGLWEFPNVSGKLDMSAAIGILEENGLKPKELHRQVEKKHVFTHIEWDMCGVYLEVIEPSAEYCWFSKEQICGEIALPTAFRQFWDDISKG